jgi:hypothetical protein
MANMERHQHNSPYHYCSVCGYRRPLVDLAWQLGALVCANPAHGCFDTMLIGTLEKMQMQKLRSPNQEMMPDRKLTSPGAANSSIQEIIL